MGSWWPSGRWARPGTVAGERGGPAAGLVRQEPAQRQWMSATLSALTPMRAVTKAARSRAWLKDIRKNMYESAPVCQRASRSAYGVASAGTGGGRPFGEPADHRVRAGARRVMLETWLKWPG